MAVPTRAATLAATAGLFRSLAAGVIGAAVIFVGVMPAQAQQPPPRPEARVIVNGEGSVTVQPDYAQIGAGVTTKAKTVKEATDANAKLMAAITAALRDSGIAQKDIQTSRFSVQPVYAPPQPNTEPKLSGFSVSNQLSITIRQIATVGTILDRVIAAGATDVGGVEFLHSDLSKALDQAREAAVADARRKAELYARAAGLELGRVVWITEDPSYAPPGSDEGAARRRRIGSRGADCRRRGHLTRPDHHWFRYRPLKVRSGGRAGTSGSIPGSNTREPGRTLNCCYANASALSCPCSMNRVRSRRRRLV